jgi:hypothetical protein
MVHTIFLKRLAEMVHVTVNYCATQANLPSAVWQILQRYESYGYLLAGIHDSIFNRGAKFFLK